MIRSLTFVSVLLLLTSAALVAGRRGSSDDLTNVFLSPERSQWLVGAIGRMATKQEVDEYLALQDDAAAERFIERFWTARDADREGLGESARGVFERRQLEADDQFTEAAYPGRRTARGIIYTLYGAPDETDYEVPKQRGGESVEKWSYGKSAPLGLDGKRPLRHYRFVRSGDLTVFYESNLERRKNRLQRP